MGYECLYKIMDEKNVIYMKEDFSDEDGICVVELEGEFVELDGWEVEFDVVVLLNGLGIFIDLYGKFMKDLIGGEKVKVFFV